MVRRSSSRARSSNSPRSAVLMVTCRISSSKSWSYSSRRTGQSPVSLALRCWSLRSSCSCRVMTSRRVAGVDETFCTHSWPSSSNSEGGRIALRMSSVCCDFAFPADDAAAATAAAAAELPLAFNDFS
eukprot:Amastigsp_a1687_218.p3 type:complete len:128 gc:universal Amastigsp_a1687_218:470-87(-)